MIFDMTIQLRWKKILQGKLQRVIIQVTTPKNLLTRIEVANIRILPCTQLQQNLLINKTTHLQSNWTPCRRFLLCRNLLSMSNPTTISDCCSLSAKFFYEPVATQYGTLDAQMSQQLQCTNPNTSHVILGQNGIYCSKFLQLDKSRGIEPDIKLQ